MGECQNPYNHNPYNHNPYCVEILIGFVEILIGFVEILIGLLDILIGQFRDFDCRDYDCRDFDCRDFDIDPTPPPPKRVKRGHLLSLITDTSA